MTFWLISGASSIFIVSGSLRTSAPPPKLNYSWTETTFSESRILQWVDDSYEVNDSGSFTDVYIMDYYTYNVSGGYFIKEDRTVYLDANSTSKINVTTSGNFTISINIDAFQVNLDYDNKINFMWFAAKNGTLEYEYYLTKRVEEYHYYEENHRRIESTFEKINLTTGETMSMWNDTVDIYDEINVSYAKREEWYPFFDHMYYISEFVMPLILTVQIYKTQRNDRIAWANMFYNFLIYKDEDQNGILSVGNQHVYAGPPNIASSTEWKGNMDAIAQNQYYELETNKTFPPKRIRRYSSPSDKTINEIMSSIVFSPPVEISETEISWNIQYPDFPLNIQFFDNDIPHEDWYFTPTNATYANTSPTNLSYGFDFILNDTQADLDVTWEIGKLTNDTAYNAVQGYGLVLPQYNFFLSSFDIDEVDQAQLSVPRDKFTFQSNNTVVAEINMGKPGKKNYTLYNFPSPSINTEFLSIGGSIHKNAIGFASQSSYYDNPLVSALFSLDEFVAQDASFVVVDDLFSMETQNYPIWNGEKLVHDPSLSIFFAGVLDEPTIDDPPIEDPPADDPLVDDPIVEEIAELIPSYNLPILIGVVSVLMALIMKKLRRKLRF
ncbi:hypothetical protein LCGC14_1654410 [marine sediment metagenome]|uniref:Uncharacterized protein n=1 Tax=marine sediment metagenome TaxID=412755 RepID=A0A0F9KW78_9ZZZZ